MSYFNIKGRPRIRQGFTLIELLVVIVIIGILASLIMVGATAARRTVRQGLIKTEITSVDGALEIYKTRYGEYPPDFSDKTAVMRHVRKRWPSYQTTESDFYSAIQSAGWNIDVNNSHGIGHVGALALWLGGPFDETRGMLGGWGLDASNPFNTAAQREEPIMELTLGRNLEQITVGSRTIYAITANKQPMVYFRPTTLGYLNQIQASVPLTYSLRHVHGGSDIGCAVPYVKSLADDFIESDGTPNPLYVNSDGDITTRGTKAIVWHNPTSYQIIHPGVDGVFGSEDGNLPCDGLLRVANPANDDMKFCTLEDNDNQANFGGNTIETSGN